MARALAHKEASLLFVNKKKQKNFILQQQTPSPLGGLSREADQGLG
jgi:hypothetical protein